MKIGEFSVQSIQGGVRMSLTPAPTRRGARAWCARRPRRSQATTLVRPPRLGRAPLPSARPAHPPPPARVGTQTVDDAGPDFLEYTWRSEEWGEFKVRLEDDLGEILREMVAEALPDAAGMPALRAWLATGYTVMLNVLVSI